MIIIQYFCLSTFWQQFQLDKISTSFARLVLGSFPRCSWQILFSQIGIFRSLHSCSVGFWRLCTLCSRISAFGSIPAAGKHLHSIMFH